MSTLHWAVTSTIAAMASVTGCARMHVTVAVLNPAVIESEEDRALVRTTLPLVLSFGAAGGRQFVTARKDEHFAFYVGIARGYEIEADATTDTSRRAELIGFADALQANFGEGLEQLYDGIGSELQDALTAVWTACDAESAKSALCRGDPSRIAQSLRRFQAVQSRALGLLPADSANVFGELARARKETKDPRASATVDMIADRTNEAIRTARRSILAGRTLVLDSPFLYAITSAEERNWIDKYNRVNVDGWFGNIDVAVRLDPEGDFSIKGVAFDPRDVARAAAKVGTQTILLTAQLAGVPTPLSSRTDSTTAKGLAASSALLQVAENERARAQADSADAVAAMRQLAGSLLERHREISTDSTGNRQVLALLRATYAALKPRILPPQPQSGVSDRPPPMP